MGEICKEGGREGDGRIVDESRVLQEPVLSGGWREGGREGGLVSDGDSGREGGREGGGEGPTFDEAAFALDGFEAEVGEGDIFAWKREGGRKGQGQGQVEFLQVQCNFRPRPPSLPPHLCGAPRPFPSSSAGRGRLEGKEE